MFTCVTRCRRPSLTDIYCVAAAAASPGAPARPVLTPSTSGNVWTSDRPPPLSRTTSISFQPAGLDWAPPVAGYCSYCLTLSLITNCHPFINLRYFFGQIQTTALVLPRIYPAPILTNTQWTRLNIFKDIIALLIISGIETNPGPTLSYLNIAHLNINSITARNKIDELHQFVEINDIKICALTETKLDETISPNMYRLDGYHPPFTKHRDRNGGGVALYTHASLPIKRLNELELEDEEWIWAKVKIQNFTILVCCIYLPPNLTASRLQLFIDRFLESASLAQTHSPATIIILGDFNAGNIYRVRKKLWPFRGKLAYARFGWLTSSE